MEKAAYQSIHLHEQDFWWYLGMKRITQTLLRRYISSNNTGANKILDVGCGAGGKFEMLSQYGAVWGIDISPDALYYADSRKLAQVTFGSVEKIPMKDGEFDMINCTEVLYHSSVGNDTLALGEFARVLKPGGILFIREPAFDWLRGHNDTVVWTKRRYSKKELTSKLEANGFEILRMSFVNCFLSPIALIVRFFERLLHRSDTPPDIYAPPFFLLNSFFKYMLYAEATLLQYIHLPFGVSIACVARKKI